MKYRNPQYQRLAITVLATFLDDICPTFAHEDKEERELRIEERIKFFDESEKELDKEWLELEKEADEELVVFLREKDIIYNKIQKTNNSERVKVKVKNFEEKKKARVEYLDRRLTKDLAELDSKNLSEDQLLAKQEYLRTMYVGKIKKAEIRYNTIIKNTQNSDNSDRVSRRLEHSLEVWARKFQELMSKHTLKETVFNTKAMELDQIRIAMSGFENELEDIKHWCLMAGVEPKECYAQAIKRAKLVGRDYIKIQEILNTL